MNAEDTHLKSRTVQKICQLIFQRLRRLSANIQLKLFFHHVHDILVQRMAAGAECPLNNCFSFGDYRDLCAVAAEIHDHLTFR